MKATCLAITFITLGCSLAFANVGAYSGSNNSFEPLKTEQVQLVSEEVTITPLVGPNADSDQVNYDCRFVLRNTSSTAATIQAGFPLDQRLRIDSVDDDCEAILSCHFIARDQRQTYHVQFVRDEKASKDKELFLWEMHFAPSEIKVLRIGYVLPMSVELASTVKLKNNSLGEMSRHYGRSWHESLETCLYERLEYTTESGKTWKGPAAVPTFRISTAGMAHWMNKRSDYILPTGEPLREHCMNVGLVYFDHSNGDWTYDAKEGFMICRIRDYKPGMTFHCAWYGTVFPTKADDCDHLVWQLLGKHPQQAEVLELAEIVAAFYGVSPHTDAVKTFVERQVWYDSAKVKKMSDLSDIERETLVRLGEIAKCDLNSCPSKGSIQKRNKRRK